MFVYTMLAIRYVIQKLDLYEDENETYCKECGKCI